ncbi:MAG: beta-ketoacyl-[acyl-carrier-protein] synthase family protein [Pirellulales bacterium]
MSATAKRRVVVTGMGLVSPLGNSPNALWESLAAGKSGIRPLTKVPADALPTKYGGEALEFSADIENFGPLDKTMQRTIRKGLKVMCREIQMAVASAQLALLHARLDATQRNPERTGVTFGSDYIMTVPEELVDGVRNSLDENGEFQWTNWAEKGLPKVDPLWLLKYLPNMPASHVAIYNDLRGPSNSITLREASSNLTLGEAYTTIVRGSADAIVAGATGTRIHPLRTIHVVLQEDVAKADVPPEQASRPFDKNRLGMVLGEGAGVLVLEERETALARGATVLAEVAGQGAAMAADRRGKADYARALALAGRKALADAGMTADDVGHVHAHGLGTRDMDRAEAQALSELFGGRRTPVPVVAAKSYFGNLGAGSGAVELIASILALQAGRLFPVLNYETPDPECPVAAVQTHDVPAGRSVLKWSVTPQGQASAIVVRAA